MLILRQYIWNPMLRYWKRGFVGKLGVILVLGALVLSTALAMRIPAHAISCSGKTYTVTVGDTLGAIAARFGASVSAIASRSNVANPNLIYVNQQLCIPGKSTTKSYNVSSLPARSSSGTVETMIKQIFGSYALGALNVARCESGFNAKAINPISIGGSHASGVFQILYPSTWRGTSQAAKSPFDAHTNIVAAHDIFIRDGHSWREWVCKP